MNHFKVIMSDTMCDHCRRKVTVYASIAYDGLVIHQHRICKECLSSTVETMEGMENEQEGL